VVVTGRPSTERVTWVLRALVLAVLAGHAVVALLLLPAEQIYAHAAEVTELAIYPILLAAAGLLYVYYRLTPDSGAAWLAAAAVFGTGQGLGLAALRIVMAERVPQRSVWLLLIQVLVGVILVAMLVLHRRGGPALDPLQVGLCLAVAISVTRLAVLERSDPSTSLEAVLPLLGAVLLVLYAAMAVLLMRSDRLPAPSTGRLGLVVVLLGTAQVLTYPLAPTDWRSLVAAALNIAGAALLAVTALELVRGALDRQAETDERVRALEGDVRVERTLLHEVAGSVAGISAASRLLTVPTGLGQDERARLTELLVAETARMHRLIAAGHDLSGPLPITDVDLDDLVEDLLLVHGIRGRVVAWHPSRLRVRARRDDLVEVLDLLLDNAARHTQSPILAVTVARRGDEVDVTVVDQGAGISPEVADSVLEWGAHGASSTGQGIGLNVAHRLVTGMGGRLRIDSSPGSGTRVAITLPVAEVSRADRSA
jgi:signal transduction histidine kinase